MKPSKDISGLLYQIKELLDAYFTAHPYKGAATAAPEKRKTTAEKEAEHERLRKKGNYELKATAAMSTVFRRMFRQALTSFMSRGLHGQLSTVFKRIAAHGEGVQGLRTVRASLYPEALTLFRFDDRYVFDRLCHARVTCTLNRNRTAVTVTLPCVDVTAAKGATHVQFRMMAGILSDYTFDAKTGTYHPLNATHNGYVSDTASGFLDLNDAQVTVRAVVLRASVPKAADSAVIVLTEMQFFTETNGKLYPLKLHHTLAVAGVL